jgi:hypothetical protein
VITALRHRQHDMDGYVDLGELAQAGATALVSAMTTDFWGEVRAKTAKVFSRGDSTRADEVTADLQRARGQLVAARPSERDDIAREIRAELRGMLRERLRWESDLTEQFGLLLEEIRAHAAAVPNVRPANQQAVADRGATIIQVGRDLYGQPPR